MSDEEQAIKNLLPAQRRTMAELVLQGYRFHLSPPNSNGFGGGWWNCRTPLDAHCYGCGGRNLANVVQRVVNYRGGNIELGIVPIPADEEEVRL